jgi:hypothetical protein
MPHIRQSSKRRRAAAGVRGAHRQCFPDGPAACARIGDCPAPIELGGVAMGSAPRRGGSNGAYGEPRGEPLRVPGPLNCCMLGCGKARRACSSARRRITAHLSPTRSETHRENVPAARFRLLGPITGDYLRPRSAVSPRHGTPDGFHPIVREALAASTVTNGQIDRSARPLPSGRRRRADRNTHPSLHPG